jgi:hypothetical protein
MERVKKKGSGPTCEKGATEASDPGKATSGAKRKEVRSDASEDEEARREPDDQRTK